MIKYTILKTKDNPVNIPAKKSAIPVPFKKWLNVVAITKLIEPIDNTKYLRCNNESPQVTPFEFNFLSNMGLNFRLVIKLIFN